MEKEIKKDTNQKPFLASETKKNYKHAPLYRSISNENYSKISYKNILKKFEVMGIQKDDPRLRYFFENMKDKKLDEKVSDESFNDILENQSKLFQKVLKGNLAVPDFTSFSNEIKDIYKKTRTNNQGKVADYIPQLKRVDPGMYGISVCTIDGQRYSIGDTNEYFCVQSTCKPINYCIALDDLGEDFVHKHVGHEPSGKGFNELTLNDRGLPHNPMINSGAIMTSSMLKPNLNIADRFDYVLNMWKKLSGSHRIGFNNSVYLSEKQTADRNFALSYFMRENNAFPENTNLLEVLEFYFQCCSIEITTDAMSIVAGTLANGGVCPTTGIKVFHPETVKNCLSLMYSCGMYDFSGEFAFRIGLPAKSGVSGAVLLVIPNVMGIAIWSPKLDSLGNSVKGLHFCEELIKKYSLHNYDTLIISQQSKKRPSISPLSKRK
ncbi:MAG: glutaminase A [Zetaproteobacteria bacterium]|nr:glutaminase A [Pseudobdellovibrionaceae bacterium]